MTTNQILHLLWDLPLEERHRWIGVSSGEATRMVRAGALVL